MSAETTGTHPELEVAIIGAGFAGLRMLIEMRKRNLNTRIIEAAGDVGGTWYWNRYPGARTDSEAWVYCYDFDDELLNDWEWPERYPTQPQVLEYMRHVAHRFNLREHIDFNTRVTGSEWIPAEQLWRIDTQNGHSYTARILCSAMGQQTVSVEPPFEGKDSFSGDQYTAFGWPNDGVDLTGTRVAVVGAGATAIQIVPLVAEVAESLTVFQRTPNYVLPARNYVITDQKNQSIKSDYKAVWQEAYSHPFGQYFPPANRLFEEVPDPEERKRIFEYGWERGGFRFLFETFDDVITNQSCNDEASEFVRDRIRAIVSDPDTAEKLCPKNYPLGGKRPPAGHFYYEAYNRPNVSLVSLPENPIQRIEPHGIRTEDGSLHEVDVIIWALGFDGVTGGLSEINAKGRNGITIKDAWETEAPSQHLGLCGPGFPNMFTLAGPQGAFGNFHSFMHKQVEWVGQLVDSMHDRGALEVEVTREAAEEWVLRCKEAMDSTVLGQSIAVPSWILGTNIPKKKAHALFYIGGVNAYNNELEQAVTAGFPGYSFR